MALMNTPDSTGQTAYYELLMFGRKVRTRLDLMKASQWDQSVVKLPRKSNITSEPKVGELVQIHKFHDQSTKLKFGIVTNRVGLSHYFIQMDQWGDAM